MTSIGKNARYNPDHPIDTVTTLPVDSVPADLYQYNDSVFFKFHIIKEQLSRETPVEDIQWKWEILRHLQILNMTTLLHDLDNKLIPINIVSDGGVHDYHSNYGVVIASKSRIIAQNMGQIYSVEFHESSYRSGLFGILAAIVSFRHILEVHKITIPGERKLHLYCDNKSVIKLVNARRESRRTVHQHRYPDADIEQQLMQELEALSKEVGTIEINHVRGHQDEGTNHMIKQRKH
jgi:ribonuclease HI